MSSIPTTEELLEQLKVLIKGLDAWKVGFPSGGGVGNLLKTFCWKKSEKGICNLINLLIDSKFIKQSTLEDYIRDLIDLNIFMQKYFKNIKLYEIGISGSLYLYVIAETPEGDWLGISTTASYYSG